MVGQLADLRHLNGREEDDQVTLLTHISANNAKTADLDS